MLAVHELRWTLVFFVFQFRCFLHLFLLINRFCINSFFKHDNSERRTALIREALHTRYSLSPYFYTLFRKANVSGIPIMRPLWLEFPQDKETFDNSEAFMVGESILVQGIYEEVIYAHIRTSYLVACNTKFYV